MVITASMGLAGRRLLESTFSLLFVAALFARQGEAEPITVNFSGTINSVVDVDGLLDGSIVLGTPFAGSFTFESTEPDGDSDANRGLYEWVIGRGNASGFSYNMEVGNYAFESPLEDPDGSVLILDNCSEHDLFGDSVEDRFAVRTRFVQAAGPEFPPESTSLITLRTFTNLSALSADALPLTPPGLDLFEINSLVIIAPSVPSQKYIDIVV